MDLITHAVSLLKAYNEALTGAINEHEFTRDHANTSLTCSLACCTMQSNNRPPFNAENLGECCRCQRCLAQDLPPLCTAGIAFAHDCLLIL